ncbi:MAG: hypothetical protein NVS3B25_09630 [Hymenobacter sp.]
MKTFNEYQEAARRTAHRPLEAYPKPFQTAIVWLGIPEGVELLRCFDSSILAMGLAGEAGEVVDLLKKVQGHGKALDKAALTKELGDALWYISNLADTYGIELADVAQENVKKLKKRYPDGFQVKASEARVDEVPFAAAEDVTQVIEIGWDANGSPSFDKIVLLSDAKADSIGGFDASDEDISVAMGKYLKAKGVKTVEGA